jgi:hypothetical protein
LAGPTCRGPAQCKHLPWTIKESAPGRKQVHDTHLKFHLGSSNTHQSGRRVLRSGGPNHSKILISFLCSSILRSGAPKSSPNPSLTRIRRVHSATRLENSSDTIHQESVRHLNHQHHSTSDHHGYTRAPIYPIIMCLSGIWSINIIAHPSTINLHATSMHSYQTT